LVKIIRSIKGRLRLYVQIVFSSITNGYITGYFNARIYKGALKAVCVPGLSCYSCPGAFGACPLGSFQTMLGSREFRFPLYVTGILVMAGALFGRFVCGWLCPFGLVQDLLYKLPFVKKIKRLPGDKILRMLKYAILIGFVIFFPLFITDIAGQGQAGFCKWICPSGALMAAWPLYLGSELIRDAAGQLFAWKSMILAALLILSITVYRPFCSYFCPLGAIYGFFNPVALYRMRVNKRLCIKCGICESVCKFSIPVYDAPNSKECIRCGECIEACPVGAIEKRIARTR
jgi:ferredoxin-type protein NapH